MTRTITTLPTLALAAAAVAVLAGCGAMSPAAPGFQQSGLPATIQVPAGHTVAMETVVDAGRITYECRAKADLPGQAGWVFVGPDAELRDRGGRTVGRYFGPPATWMAADGSAVTGKQLAVAPAGTGNIPFQLVKANPATGTGAMQGVAYIQRVALRGGVAPATPCATANVGARETVGYQAEYIFWTAG